MRFSYLQDLLEHVNRGYADADSNSATPLAANRTDDFSAALGGLSGDGRMAAPSSYRNAVYIGGAIARPSSASGGTGPETEAPYESRTYTNGPGGSLQRSQSAAPTYSDRATTIGPPPGMPRLATSKSDSYSSFLVGGRRPASTGVLGNQSSALRPAGKTIMDLIQEDSPDGETRGSYPGETDRMALVQKLETTYGQQEQLWQRDGLRGSEVQQQQQQVQMNDVYDQTRPGEMRQQTQMMQQQRYGQEMGLSSFSREQHRYGGDVRTEQPSMYGQPPPQQHSQQQQQLLQSQQLQPQIQSGPFHEQQLQQMQPGQFQQQQQVHAQGQRPQQQIYYQGPQQLQQHVETTQPGRLQAQVLPSGQTVYVNAPVGAAASQQQQYVVQYAQQQQQPQIIHQSIQGARDGQQQYVSVVPTQGGTPQIMYWPPDSTQTLAPVTIVGAPGPGSQPTPMSRIGNMGTMETTSPSGQYGRTREKSGGGRGRRTGTRRGGGGADGKSVSSPLLEDFRSTKNRDWTMHQIEGHVVEFCQDQNGSRFIQQRLEMGDPTEQQIAMQEVLPAIRRLRNDVFGNYVVQKLLDFGTPQMKADIRDTLEGELLQLSLQMYGCRVVQKALEALAESDLPALLVEFHHNVLSCIHDQNGNHVIQKCIEVMCSRAKKARASGNEGRATFLTDQIEFIVNDVLFNTVTLSCHPYGCRVLQRILEHCDENRKTAVLDEIRKCHRKLLDDQYGNYVIQHVLQFGRQEDRDSILEIIVESGLLGLSRQKFASNVVEKLLKYGNGPQRRAVVREMLKVSLKRSNRISSPKHYLNSPFRTTEGGHFIG